MKTANSLSKARDGAMKATGEARQAVDQLRDLRVRLLDERDEVASRPLPFELAAEAAEQAIQRRAEAALDRLSVTGLMRPADRRRPHLEISDEQAADLAFAANAAAIAGLIRERLEQECKGSKPLAPEDRDREIERLDAEILAAELAEEGLIRGLEQAGIEMLRRPDADPRALLVSDAELT
ncbi:hypothetical protein [Roseovarius sp.]|uniref:hypothetical protein n=1 Tax=Roseovarius sp. TaxID=1486281 RepID=UPI003BA885B3